jgi:hypothetical protein
VMVKRSGSPDHALVGASGHSERPSKKKRSSEEFRVRACDHLYLGSPFRYFGSFTHGDTPHERWEDRTVMGLDDPLAFLSLHMSFRRRQTLGFFLSGPEKLANV